MVVVLPNRKPHHQARSLARAAPSWTLVALVKLLYKVVRVDFKHSLNPAQRNPNCALLLWGFYVRNQSHTSTTIYKYSIVKHILSISPPRLKLALPTFSD